MPEIDKTNNVGTWHGMRPFMSGICELKFAWKQLESNAGRVFGASNIENLQPALPIQFIF
jgi:hypothetical protein